ncbi:DDE-type integrase/transposase/recombinase [Neobacillus cucumis]|uniref:DDE-type integrase/transposase/recombinase n=1 Tax=Neobacillus cucumis TaxID=1740721 RepID=UPI0035A334E8
MVAWNLSERNNLKLVLDAMEDLNKKKLHGTILHSDQGFQYTSKKYNKRLNKYGLKGSHSRKENCLDNPVLNHSFPTLKQKCCIKLIEKQGRVKTSNRDIYV